MNRYRFSIKTDTYFDVEAADEATARRQAAQAMTNAGLVVPALPHGRLYPEMDAAPVFEWLVDPALR